MKASSTVLQSPQTPYTVYGMPLKTTALLLPMMAPLVPVLAAIGIPFLTFIIPLTFLVGGGIYIWILRRRNPHFETGFLLPYLFFKGKKSRVLIAGNKPNAK